MPANPSNEGSDAHVDFRSIPSSHHGLARWRHLACHANLDLGFGLSIYGHDIDGHPSLSCRIQGINAPELATDTGKAAATYAATICPPGTRVTIISHGWDKYGGRFDGSITLPDGSDFAQAMVAAGHAVVYP